IPVAAVGGVLDEVPGLDPLGELLGCEEVIVDPLLLAVARAPRRRRCRELELGNEAAEGADHGSLADAGGTGDDEYGRHDGRFLLLVRRRGRPLSGGAAGRRARSAAAPRDR